MADGELTLTFDQALSDQLRAAAAEAGLSVEEYARQALKAHAQEPLHDWTEADAALEEYDRTGEARDAEEVLNEFVAEVKRRAALRT